MVGGTRLALLEHAKLSSLLDFGPTADRATPPIRVLTGCALGSSLTHGTQLGLKAAPMLNCSGRHGKREVKMYVSFGRLAMAPAAL